MLIKKNKGFTFAEVTIAILLMAFLGLAISKLMTNTQKQAARGRCKSVLRQSMKMASMYLQKDIASSRVIYVKDEKDGKYKYKMTLELGDSASNPIKKIEVPKRKVDDSSEAEEISYFNFDPDPNNPDVEKQLYNTVDYKISNGILTRYVEDGSSRKIAENIVSIGQMNNNNQSEAELSYSGKLELIIKLKAKIEGFDEYLDLEEPLIISVRQLQNKINMGSGENQIDNHWKQRVGKNDF